MREFTKEERSYNYWQPGDGSPTPEFTLPQGAKDVLKGSISFLLTYKESLQRFLVMSLSNFYSDKRVDPADRYDSPNFRKLVKDLIDLGPQRFEG